MNIDPDDDGNYPLEIKFKNGLYLFEYIDCLITGNCLINYGITLFVRCTAIRCC